MNNITEEFFVFRFKHFSSIWKYDIERSLESNLDLFADNSGAMGEYLAHLITGKSGLASAGSGFDLYDSDNDLADEAKLCVNLRGTYCNPKKNGCGKRYLFWNKPETCSCGKDLSKTGGKGARAGIDAKAGLKYHNQMDKYVIQVLDPLENNKDCKDIKYTAFVINAKDINFTEYLQYQLDEGSKNTCNFLPYSYDFYRTSPIKVVELNVNIVNNNIEVIFFNLNNNKPELMTKEAIKGVRGINETKEYLKNNNLLNKIGTLEAKHFKLGKKNHGKDRGKTSRN